jgi:hypothetical protein
VNQLQILLEIVLREVLKRAWSCDFRACQGRTDGGGLGHMTGIK